MERFSYDLEMKTREQNRNNKRKEIERWLLAAVRVKGGMSLRDGMWHGLRNDIIMRNVKYGKWRKEIN